MSEEPQNKRLMPPERARAIDHDVRGHLATATRGISPVDVAAALVDWAGHLALSPAKIMSLAETVALNAAELAAMSGRAIKKDAEGLPMITDRRMRSDAWQHKTNTI